MKKYGIALSIVASIIISANVYTAEIEFSYKHFAAVLDEYVDEFGMVNYLRLKQDRTALHFISLHLKNKDRAFWGEGILGVKYLKYEWSLNARNAQ